MTKQASSATRCRRCLRGDLRYADRLGDLFSDAPFSKGEKNAAEQDLAALHAIPRDQLNATDQIAYDVFEDQTEENLKGFAPDLLAISEALPMNHFFGLHTEYPTFASGQGAAPFEDGSRTMRTTSSATATSPPTSMKPLRSGKRARRKELSTPS